MLDAQKMLGLACLFCLACSSDPSGTDGSGTLPHAGKWVGEELSFSYANGKITDLVLNKQSCSASGNTCSGEIGGPILGSFAASSSVVVNAGATKIEGKFTSLTTASGSLSVPGGSCCTVIGAWSATWVPGSGPVETDAGPTGGDDATLNGSDAAVIQSKPGSVDWNGASTGTKHPGPSQAVASPPAPANLSQAQKDSILQLNQLRAQVGSPMVAEDAHLAQAAQAHAQFYVDHVNQYNAAKLSPHSENATFGKGFTGVQFWDRTKAAGFTGQASGEVMAFINSVPGSLQGWLDTVYHRLPLLSPETKLMGYGGAGAAAANCDVIDFGGGGSSATSAIIVYPWPGQSGVPASWSGNEGPTPKAPPKGYPSGPVITARWPVAIQVKVHKLTAKDGTDIAHVYLDAANDGTLASFDKNTSVVYANKPLAAGGYTMRFEYDDKGPQVLQWRFVVGP